MAWYLYDMEFCRRASHNQLYVDTFTGVPKAILCKACSSSDHVTNSPFHQGLQTLGPKCGDLCFNFNKRVPCARTTLTNATSLDALQPTQEKTTLTPQALDPPSQRIAAQDIPPEAAIEYLSKLSPTTPIDLPQLALYLCDHPHHASVDAVENLGVCVTLAWLKEIRVVLSRSVNW